MKIIVVLVVMFSKWTLLGVPLWFSASVFALLALGIAYGYRRLRKRSAAPAEGELADMADPHGDSSDGEIGRGQP